MVRLEKKAVVFEGSLAGSAWGASHGGSFLWGRRRLQAARVTHHTQVSDLDDWGWRVLCTGVSGRMVLSRKSPASPHATQCKSMPQFPLSRRLSNTFELLSLSVSCGDPCLAERRAGQGS